MSDSFHDRIQEIERLADALNDLLATRSAALEYGGLYQQAHGLARWAKCYRHGLRYGMLEHDGATHDLAWTSGVNDRLRLEAQELYSLDERCEYLEDAEPEAHPETEGFMEATRHILRAASDAGLQGIFVPPIALRTMLEAQDGVDASYEQGLVEQEKAPARVKDLMKKNPVMVTADCTLAEAAQEMENMNCGILPVGTPDRLEGVITDRDIVLRAVAKGKDVSSELVRDYMTAEVCCVQEDEDSSHAADLMRRKNVNRLLVKDGRGRPRGIVSFGRLMRDHGGHRRPAPVLDYGVGRQIA